MQLRVPAVTLASLLCWGGAQATPLEPGLFPRQPPTSEAPAAFARPGDAPHGDDAPWERRREVAGDAAQAPSESDAGPYVLLGGGLDGYTGALGDRLRRGPAVGACVGVKDRYIGVEGGYSVSGVNVNLGPGGAGPGSDILRNSAQAALTVGLVNAPFQPFLLGGGGLDRYRVRHGQAEGFRDSTNFYAPLGAGVRWNLTRLLTLDARGTYNFLFGEGFAPGAGGNRYQGQASVGGTF